MPIKIGLVCAYLYQAQFKNETNSLRIKTVCGYQLENQYGLRLSMLKKNDGYIYDKSVLFNKAKSMNRYLLSRSRYMLRCNENHSGPDTTKIVIKKQRK